MNRPISRRTAIRKAAGFTATVAVATALLPKPALAQDNPPAKLKGNINYAVCRWCYPKIKLDDLCAASRDMGITGIDLLQPEDFPTLKKYGLVCPMVSFPTIGDLGGIPRAWNRVEHHDLLVQAYEPQLRQVAAAGFERLICFSGNRAGLADEQGLENCALGLQRILTLAEKLKVTLCMELLNIKRTHKDYQRDHVAWATPWWSDLVPSGSSCSTISSTCKSWMATCVTPSAKTTDTSTIITPAACRAAQKLTKRRS